MMYLQLSSYGMIWISPNPSLFDCCSAFLSEISGDANLLQGEDGCQDYCARFLTTKLSRMFMVLSVGSLWAMQTLS